MTRLVLSLAVLALPTLATAADWTGFRGTGSAAVATDGDYPGKWTLKDNLRWKVDLPGRGLSNPIVAGGKVIVTACSGFKQRRLHVLCFDEKTGVKLWERQFTATGNTQCHPTSNMAAPSPVSDGKAVYALFATGDLAALALDGQLLWYRSLVSDYPDITNQVGMAASPALYRNVLLLPLENAGESFAAGLDTATGKNLWKVPRVRTINWVSPIVREKNGVASAIFYTGKEITAYDPLTGKVQWTMERGGSDITSATQGEGLLFVPGGEFRALRPRDDGGTPDVVWSSTRLGGAAGASPIYHAGRVYAMTSAGLRCVDAKDGSEKWFQRVTGRFWASPVLAGDKVYTASEAGKVAVIRIGDKPDLLAEVDLGQKLLATPALANGALFLRTDEALYCVGK